MNRRNHRGLVFSGAALVGCLALAGQVLLAQDDYQQRFRENQAQLRILGAGSCARCHSAQNGYFHLIDLDPLNEYTLWRGNGSDGVHANTFQLTLESDRSKTMAEILHKFDNQGDNPTKRKDCLACHALGYREGDKFFQKVRSEEEEKEKEVIEHNGVSCESCHGRAVEWEGSHRFLDWNPPWNPKWTAAQNREAREKSKETWLAEGMYETRDVLRRAEKCAECHIGNSPGRQITHDMMGAGHPDLSFELASDSFDVPKHWREKRSYLPGVDEGSWFYARLWVVGQMISMREAMNALANTQEATPDFAMLDCYACHHEFLRTPSRAASTQKAGRVGEPAWNEAPFILARHAARAIDPSSFAQIEHHLADLQSAISIRHADWDKVHSAARSLVTIADRLARAANEKQFDRAATVDLLVHITADADAILRAGPFAADHAYRALRILYGEAWCASKEPPNHALIEEQIVRLRKLIYPQKNSEASHKENNSPVLNSLDPDEFRDAMKQLHDAFAASGTSGATADAAR